MAKQDDYIRTALRVPPELHKELHRTATEAGRTFNAEIVHRLLASFVADQEAALLKARIEELTQALDQQAEQLLTTFSRLRRLEQEQVPIAPRPKGQLHTLRIALRGQMRLTQVLAQYLRLLAEKFPADETAKNAIELLRNTALLIERGNFEGVFELAAEIVRYGADIEHLSKDLKDFLSEEPSLPVIENQIDGPESPFES